MTSNGIDCDVVVSLLPGSSEVVNTVEKVDVCMCSDLFSTVEDELDSVTKVVSKYFVVVTGIVGAVDWGGFVVGSSCS